MRVLTVQELTRHIKMLLEKDYLLANVWVRGEISNFKPASSGHFYFTLKDDCSSLKVVMFRSRSRLVPFRPENGMAVPLKKLSPMEPERSTLPLNSLKQGCKKKGCLTANTKKSFLSCRAGSDW